MTPIRILIATPLLSTQSGGPAQYAVGLERAFESKGHSVDVIAFQDVAKYPTIIRHIFLFLRACIRIRKVDIVIVLDTLSMALPVVIASFLSRKKVIVRVGGDFVWEQYVERTKNKIPLSEFYTHAVTISLKERFCLWLQKHIIIPLADVVAFSTAWQRDIWAEPYSLRERRVEVIENAYRPFANDQMSGVHKNRVLWIGRDIVLKNVALLDEVIESVKRGHPSLVYKKFSGLPHEEVVKELRNCRMLVIPSISEVSPNLALEALALGVPVLVTKDCGLRDVLGDAVTWIDPRSAVDIRSRIEELMTEEGYAKARLRVSAWKGVRTYTIVSEDFLRLLRDMFGDPI